MIATRTFFRRSLMAELPGGTPRSTEGKTSHCLTSAIHRIYDDFGRIVASYRCNFRAASREGAGRRIGIGRLAKNDLQFASPSSQGSPDDIAFRASDGCTWAAWCVCTPGRI